MRNHPYLTQLDGDNFMDALTFQQNNIMKAHQKYLLIRQYATTQTDDSHLAIRAVKHKATQIPEPEY